MKKFRLVAMVSAAALAIGAPAMASELVTNGDFSSGFAGFTTNYSEIPPGSENDATGDLFMSTNPGGICGCWASINDHTTGTGNMLVIDGAANANSIIWSETVAVLANAAYQLSFSAVNLNFQSPQPSVVASVNGTSIIDTDLLPVNFNAPVWLNFSQTFNSGAATSLTISFVDPANTHFFNDLALDDISLTGPAPEGGVPEPAAWALMIAGFGLTGATLRRRRAAVPARA